MQNILAVRFEIESEGYQAITTLSAMPVTDITTILEMALVKREGGQIKICDSYSSGLHTTDDTAKGGLIGGLLGIIGGPIGILLGGSAGALTGSVIDMDDAKNSASLIEMVSSKLIDGETALIILADEASETVLNEKLSSYHAEVLRFDAAVIAAEVEAAQELQKDMERKAKAELRAARKDEHKKKVEEKRAKIAADFEKFKAKFKK